MNKDEIIQMMEEKGYEEISLDEYRKLPTSERECLGTGLFFVFFKPKQKFPIVFNDQYYKIEVESDGSIGVTSRCFNFTLDVSLLEQALQKSKELRNKTCIHEWDTTMLLTSNPPQEQCKKCGETRRV